MDQIHRSHVVNASRMFNVTIVQTTIVLKPFRCRLHDDNEIRFDATMS